RDHFLAGHWETPLTNLTKRGEPGRRDAGRAPVATTRSALPAVPATAALRRATDEPEQPQDQGRDQHVPQHLEREAPATDDRKDQKKRDERNDHLGDTSRLGSIGDRPLRTHYS